MRDDRILRDRARALEDAAIYEKRAAATDSISERTTLLNKALEKREESDRLLNEIGR